MTYIRSRPWRPRGPWFCNRAGARRRGRRNDELVFASAGEMTLGDGLPTEPQDLAEDDVLVPVLESRPVPERMLTTAADYVLGLDSGLPAADRIPQRLDRIAEDVIAAHTLSRQRDDDAGTRQSA
jgi:hypothetical protein